jgi:pheromone shutdown protein TraB
MGPDIAAFPKPSVVLLGRWFRVSSELRKSSDHVGAATHAFSVQIWIGMTTMLVCAAHILRSTFLGWLFSVPLLMVEGALSVAGTMLNTDRLVPVQIGFLAAWVAILAARRLVGGRRPC